MYMYIYIYVCIYVRYSYVCFSTLNFPNFSLAQVVIGSALCAEGLIVTERQDSPCWIVKHRTTICHRKNAGTLGMEGP